MEAFVTGDSRSGTFFRFFSEKCSFLLSVFRKNLNKEDEGWGAFIGGCRCRAPVGTVDSEKFLKFFLKSGAKTYPSLAITPIEGHFVAGIGKIRLFWGRDHKKSKDFRKKLGFLLSVCRKNLNIHNEHTAREDQLPAKRKEERMQQTVKRIIKNRRTDMS